MADMGNRLSDTGGEGIAPDDFYKLVMTEKFCDEPDDLPPGFTCE